MSDKSQEKQVELIEEPTEVDVLCGRGGGSNHNPGNAWYRRLIRSNRSLYRACPKHTKLLVSKAIVQAVQQQGGRFLEKDKRTNMYVEVSYKRAVDKTSQGLRERDRDDESDGTDEDEQHYGAEAQSSRKRMVVPDEFSGRNKNPNMSELATVAIGMIDRGNESSKLAGTVSGGSSKRQKVQVVVGKKSRSNLLDDDDDDDDDDEAVVMKKLDGRGVKRAIQASPPPLHTNQTSTFRLLNQPNDLTETSAQTATALPGATSTFLPSFSQAFGLPRPPGVQASVSQPFDPTVPGIYWVNPASPNPVAFLPVPMTGSAPPPLSRLTSQVSDWLTSFWPVGKEPQQGNGQASSASVSGSVPTSISNQLKIPASSNDRPQQKTLHRSITEQLKIPAPCNDKPQINTLPPPKRIVHMQQRVQQKRQQAKATEQQKAVTSARQRSTLALEPVTRDAKGTPQVVTQQQAQLEAWQRFQAQKAAIQEQYEQTNFEAAGTDNLPSLPGTGRTALVEDDRTMRTSPAKLRDGSRGSYLTAYDGSSRLDSDDVPGSYRHVRDTGSASDDDDDARLAAEPTELEHSVSATLLRLARSGRLESGITTFFDRHQSIGSRIGDDMVDDEPSGSLLDDHHDTEAESRMRLI